MEKGLTKNQILSELTKSTHGKLVEYIDVGQKAVKQEPEFMAHLIAWNAIKGQVRDSQVALPILSLTAPSFPSDLLENSLAHLVDLGPRELLRAYRFSYEAKVKGKMKKTLTGLVHSYLREIEKPWKRFEEVGIQHRHTLKELYALTHTRPGSDKIRAVLFGQLRDGTKVPLPHGSIFEKVHNLKDMSPEEAAGTILEAKIPFLIAKGALGKKIKEESLILALIKRMSATELVTNSKLLEELGMNNSPALKGAYNEALEKAQKSTKNVLKTTKAAENVKDEETRSKLRGLQDKQLQSLGVEGDWLVLGDRSGSMSHSIQKAREVAATLAKMVKGKVWLVFFDTSPQTIDVTGLPLDKINELTKHIHAGGGTSIGCGLQRMLDSNVSIDGIAIVSDGGERNSPFFPDVYKKYSKKFDKEVPVYFYQVPGDEPFFVKSMEQEKLDMQIFDLRKNQVDYYSLPNLVKTMRTNRYSLIDEIMAVPLKSLGSNFKSTMKKEVVHVATV